MYHVKKYVIFSCRKFFVVPSPTTGQQLYHIPGTVKLGTGAALILACSNNPALGNKEFAYFYNGYKDSWNLSGGWIGLRLFNKTDFGQDYKSAGPVIDPKTGKKKRRASPYCFISDTSTLYHTLLDADLALEDAVETIVDEASEKYNKRNSTVAKWERTTPLVWRILDWEHPSTPQAKHKVYLALIASTWHFNHENEEQEGFVSITDPLRDVRVQLKYISKDFNQTSCMKQGGLFVRACDFLQFLKSKDLEVFLQKVATDPRVQLNYNYCSQRDERLCDEGFRQDAVKDLTGLDAPAARAEPPPQSVGGDEDEEDPDEPDDPADPDYTPPAAVTAPPPPPPPTPPTPNVSPRAENPLREVRKNSGLGSGSKSKKNK